MSTAPTAQYSRPLINRLRRGGAWVVAGRTSGMATVLVTLMFLTRALTAADFAAYILTLSLVALFSMAAMFGLNTLLCRYLSESFAVGDARRARYAITRIASLAGVSTLLVGSMSLLVLKWAGPDWFGLPQLSEHAGLIALWIVLLAVSQIVAEAFRGLHDLRMAGALSGVSGGLVANALFLVGAVCCSFLGPLDYRHVLMLAIVCLFTSTTASAAYLLRRWPRSQTQDASEHNLAPLTVKAMMGEAWPVTLTQIGGFGVAQLDIWIVALSCSDMELAIYGVARRLSLLVAVPLTQISIAISSSIAELHARGDRDNLQRVVRGAATLSVLGSALPTLALVLFPGMTLAAIFGTHYAEGARTLQILLLGQAIFSLTGPCGPTLLMTGHQRVSLWSLILVLPIYGFAPWAARDFGMEAVAMIFAVAVTAHNLIQLIAVARILAIATTPCFSPGYIWRLLRA